MLSFSYVFGQWPVLDTDFSDDGYSFDMCVPEFKLDIIGEAPDGYVTVRLAWDSNVLEIKKMDFAGAPDSNYGSFGEFALDPGDIEPHDAYVLADGSVCILGLETISDEELLFHLIRVTADGAIDGSFGIDGYVSYPAGNFDSGQLEVSSTGECYVYWKSTPDPENAEVFHRVFKFYSNGIPDGAFGDGGVASFQVYYPAASEDSGGQIYDMSLASDALIFVGMIPNEFGSNELPWYVFAKLNLDGTYAVTAGSDGVVVGNFPGFFPVSLTIQEHQNGDYYVFGNKWNVLSSHIRVFRLQPDGSVEENFGDGEGFLSLVEGYSELLGSAFIGEDGLLYFSTSIIYLVDEKYEEYDQAFAVRAADEMGNPIGSFGDNGLWVFANSDSGYADESGFQDSEGRLVFSIRESLDEVDCVGLIRLNSEATKVPSVSADISVFPNPARNKLNVSGVPGLVDEVRVVSVSGVKIDCEFDQTSEHLTKIRLREDVSPGLYVATLRSNMTFQLVKFLVE